MSFPLLGSPKPTFFDSSGNLLSSGTLSVLNPADDTNRASYPTADDADASTNANVNPVVLDARGEPPVGLFGKDGVTYKLVLKDSAGATIWTVDDVKTPIGHTQATIGALLYPITSAETSAGVTPTDYSYPPGNVLRYGAVGDGVTDDTAAFSAALGVCVNGLKMYAPAGVYSLTEFIAGDGLQASINSITFEGDGPENTVLDFAAGTGAGIQLRTCLHSVLRGFSIRNATTYNLGLLGSASGYQVYSQITLDNIRSQSAGTHGFYFERGHTCKLSRLFAKNSGIHGFNFSGYHTSFSVDCCYSDDAASNGFLIRDVSYSTFYACAADSSGSYGYNLGAIKGVALQNCGAESNARAGFAVSSTDAINTDSTIVDNIDGVVLDGCFATNNDTGGGGYGNLLYLTRSGSATLRDVKVRGCKEVGSPAASIVGTGSPQLHIEGAPLVGTVSGVQVLPTHNSIFTGGVSVTAANTAICNLANLYTNNSTNYGGLVLVTARSGDFATTSANTATYCLLVGKHGAGSGVTVVASNGLTAGTGTTWPSFTWTINTTTNELEASPVGSTSGSFYFCVSPVGSLSVI